MSDEATKDEDPVLLEINGPVAVIVNNRPRVHNAASDAFNRRLWECLYELHVRDDIRAVVWRGNGPSFSSGRDLRELGGPRDNGMSNLQHVERGHNWTKMLWTCPAPIIVAMRGAVCGGMFERALLCDLRIAAPSARMWLPEIHHGVVPDSGGVARLFQIAGHGLAADMALTGRRMDAAEAHMHGIVSRVVDEDALDATAIEMAHDIAKLPAFGVKMFRRSLRRMSIPMVERFMEEEALAMSEIYHSDDYKEFKAAKAEGRDPIYRSR